MLDESLITCLLQEIGKSQAQIIRLGLQLAERQDRLKVLYERLLKELANNEGRHGSKR